MRSTRASRLKRIRRTSAHCRCMSTASLHSHQLTSRNACKFLVKHEILSCPLKSRFILKSAACCCVKFSITSQRFCRWKKESGFQRRRRRRRRNTLQSLKYPLNSHKHCWFYCGFGGGEGGEMTAVGWGGGGGVRRCGRRGGGGGGGCK